MEIFEFHMLLCQRKVWELLVCQNSELHEAEIHFTIEQTMKAQTGSGGIALHFL
jgi:hypothetical protein